MAAAGKNVSKRKSTELDRDRQEAASVRKQAPNPVWFKPVMFGFMLLGLVWLVVNYLAGDQIPFMFELGAWNYGIGFGLFVIGLLMTMGWR